MTNYENCCLYDKQKCGRYIGDRSEKSGLVRILELTSDIESHIRNFDFRSGLECLKWTEKELIENPLGKAIDGSKLICEFHWNTYGIRWYQVRHCLHPLHPPYKKGKKSVTTTLAPLWVVKQMDESQPFSFPVGGRICRQHLRLETDKSKSPTKDIHLERDDPLYEPEQINVDEELQNVSTSTSHQLTDILEISHVTFQIVKSSVRDVGCSTKKKLKRKLMQVQDISVKKMAELLAPSQGEELIAEVLNESSDEAEILNDILPWLKTS